MTVGGGCGVTAMTVYWTGVCVLFYLVLRSCFWALIQQPTAPVVVRFDACPLIWLVVGLSGIPLAPSFLLDCSTGRWSLVVFFGSVVRRSFSGVALGF